MARVIAIVDGLNLFHALKLQSPLETNLDLDRLVRRLMDRKSDSLVEIQYFSAAVAHLSEKARLAQAAYLDSLKQTGVRVVLGNFKRKEVLCPVCGSSYFKHEEKETDVNIALAISMVASKNSADKLLLFSADTDLIPAIKLAKTLEPKLDIRLVSTVPYLRNVYASMGRLSDGQIRLVPEFISIYQFPSV